MTSTTSSKSVYKNMANKLMFYLLISSRPVFLNELADI